MRKMDEEEAKKWAIERQKNLTAEDYAKAEEAKKRFEELSEKGRIVKVGGLIETPDIVLAKMVNGLRELDRLPVEPEMMDGALSAQGARFQALAEFFEARQDVFPRDEHSGFVEELRSLTESIESFRMTFLETGDKRVLDEIANRCDVLRCRIEKMWVEEDADNG